MAESKQEAAVAVWKFQDNAVRIEMENDKPWFHAGDVCKVLGYANDTDALNKHCKKDGVAKRDSIDSLSRKQHVTFINEANLYRLVTRSKMPNAEKFTDWVTEEVLPSIRKTGGYALPGTQLEAALKAQNEVFAMELVKSGMRIQHLQAKCQTYQEIIKRIGFDPDDYQKSNKRGDKRIRIVRAGLRGGKGAEITYKGDLKTIGLMMQPNLPFIETVEAMPERIPFTKTQMALIQEAKATTSLQRSEA